MNARNIFNEFEQEEIVAAIKSLELKTSCEIRLHIEEKTDIPIAERAKEIFDFLEMQQTRLRNGILLYISLFPMDAYFHFDQGILESSVHASLEEIGKTLSEKISDKQLLAGIKEVLWGLGEQLSAPFPYQPDDVNELPNEISFG